MPSWLHLGGQVGTMLATFSNKKGEGRDILLSSLFFFVGSLLFFDVGALRAPFWRHLDSILEGLGLDFRDFPSRFGLDFSGFPRGFGLDFGNFP